MTTIWACPRLERGRAMRGFAALRTAYRSYVAPLLSLTQVPNKPQKGLRFTC
jgi:hypothetical protein